MMYDDDLSKVRWEDIQPLLIEMVADPMEIKLIADYLSINEYFESSLLFPKKLEELQDSYHNIVASEVFVYIRKIGTKYKPIIQIYENQLDEILTFEKVTTVASERDVAGTNEEDAYTDSSIRKLNDTPNAGNNPDLLTDTYLSESERSTLDGGARKRTIAESVSDDSVTTVVDNAERFKLISKLNDSIKDAYELWAQEIVLRYFVL